MKTLLQINIVVNYGSTGRIIEELSQTACKNGWNSYIAYGRKDKQNNPKTLRIGSYWDVIFHGLQTRIFDIHGFGSSNATHILLKQIEKIKPDIIHLHNLHGYYINIEVLFNYIASKNIPVVWTLHDCWPITGHCVYFDTINCQKWKTNCFNCPQKHEYPASYIFDNSRRNYLLKNRIFNSLNKLTIVPVSDWLGEIVKESYLAKYPTKVINNGIDIDLFHPHKQTTIREKFKVTDKFIILGVASVWSPRKGLNDFIKLSKKIDSNCCIILIGLSKYQRLFLPSNIIGLGRTESIQELVSFYSEADVFINPSLEESFGLTTVEAFACGVPAIVFNATASPRLIMPETGFIVEKGNINGLVDAIKTIKERGKASFSQACRELAMKLYNKKYRHMDYINLYESILTDTV
jgi:glycosyltransferase involved in cell wall biosynthesis